MSEHQTTKFVSKGADIVRGRAPLYGSPVPNMERIAQAWGAILGVAVRPLDVCMMFVVLKVVRETHGGHLEDNLDDIEGYVEIARQVVSQVPVQEHEGEVPGAYSNDPARP